VQEDAFLRYLNRPTWESRLALLLANSGDGPTAYGSLFGREHQAKRHSNSELVDMACQLSQSPKRRRATRAPAGVASSSRAW
jgi:hypothetical protein